MLLLRRAVGLRDVASGRGAVVGLRGLGERGALGRPRVVAAPLATAASRWMMDEWAGGATRAAVLEHPWRAGLAGRGLSTAVRVSVDVEQTRNKDPQQMLNMFRRKCRQNNIHSKARANRYHKKPTQVRRQRINRCEGTCQPAQAPAMCRRLQWRAVLWLNNARPDLSGVSGRDFCSLAQPTASAGAPPCQGEGVELPAHEEGEGVGRHVSIVVYL